MTDEHSWIRSMSDEKLIAFIEASAFGKGENWRDAIPGIVGIIGTAFAIIIVLRGFLGHGGDVVEQVLAVVFGVSGVWGWRKAKAWERNRRAVLVALDEAHRRDLRYRP
jgi:hypothetical protein